LYESEQCLPPRIESYLIYAYHSSRSLAGLSEEAAMKARRLIDGAALGPATLKAMGQAFDQAWEQIAGNFGDSPLEVESARLSLAEAMLFAPTEDSTDAAALKAGALQAMAMDYLSGIRPAVRDPN